jgi:molybdopterin synthase sulfur carrier subunit
LTLLYFAWVRQTLGTGEEEMALPAHVHDVRDLIAHLKSRGGAYARAFVDGSRIRVAVNQRHAGPDAPVREEDEVAFFPPVTGG